MVHDRRVFGSTVLIGFLVLGLMRRSPLGASRRQRGPHVERDGGEGRRGGRTEYHPDHAYAGHGAGGGP